MDPAKMKVVDLRSELGALGLDTKGNKAALVERLKKALETKTGKAFADTSILDTTTEDMDEPATPRKITPAARITRRSSSSRIVTPAKPIREDPPEPIDEDVKAELEEPKPTETIVTEELPKKNESPIVESPGKVDTEDSNEVCYVEQENKSPITVEDEQSQSQDNIVPPVENESQGDTNPSEEVVREEKVQETEKMEQDVDDNGDKDDDRRDDDSDGRKERDKDRELTEEEEWALLNERLKIREEERLERERIQAEEDAKRFEEMSKDPIKLQRLKRKQEKKARWSNFYKTVAVTNEVLTPPVEEEEKLLKKVDTTSKAPEPEINDDKITLSWYDSDLNQYLELPDLNSVVPMNEGALAHAWAGCRASHGIKSGRVCFEVRVGTIVTTTETTDKEVISNGLRVGWSTDDSNLHLGDGELSWGYESTGRAVHGGQFKEYGSQFTEKDVVGAYLDLESNPCKISYTLNGAELGVAFEFDKSELGERAMYPHVLTKNTCYKVNLGYDRYNMLTRTKVVRQRIEVPIEQILEEKKAREAEIKRLKEEAMRRSRERRDKERKEREERQKKKREERERSSRERKDKEAEERKERGEDEPEEAEKDAAEQQEQEKQADADDESVEQPKENGESEVKAEPMEVEQAESEEAPPPPLPSQPKPDDSEAAEDKDDEKETEVKTEQTEVESEEVTEEELLKGQILLDKRMKNVIRFVVEEELDGAEAELIPGYVLIAKADLVPGPRPPLTPADCEVILMVGMPGSGKTYWVKNHIASNPDKRYNILSTGALFDKMKVDCKPFRGSYEGRWDAMVTKCAKCVLRLLEIAKGRRRNFILDQTNVYPSAQRRKLREFDGYRRVAVVVVTDEDTYKERQKRREEADGKEVPDGAVVDMKANFTLPEKGAWLDDVIYAELDEEESKKIIEGFHKEAKAAGVVKEREKRERSASRDGPPPHKRQRDDRRHSREDRRPRDFGRDREDRWGGSGGRGGGQGRWGPAARGGRWGGSRDRGGHVPPGRFDRQWGGPQHNSDHRDNFRGGRGGHGGPNHGLGMGGPGGPAGMRTGDRGGRVMNDSRFNRDRSNNRGPPTDKRQGSANMGGGTGMGSWQRGGVPPQGGGRGSRAGGPAGAQGSQGPPGSQGALARSQGKDASGQNQNQGMSSQSQNQASWNQWASNWGGWGNWNQNQGWGNWGNWGWGNPQSGAGNQSGTGGQSGAKGGQGQQGNAGQSQWAGNYTAQQWYQWQQWQQQQHGWPGYQQSQGSQQSGNVDPQAWAQYYQSYGSGNNTSSAAVTGVPPPATDKK